MQQFIDKQDYLNKVCEQIKWKSAHDTVKKELSNHIDDQAQAYIKKGIEEEKALQKAVEEMGQAQIVGEQLDKVYKPKKSILAIITIAMLLAFGVWANIALGIADNALLVTVLLGTAVFTTAYFFDFCKFIKKYAILLYLIYCIGCIIFIAFGPKINGRAEVSIFNISFSLQYVVLLYPIIYAGIIDKFCQKGMLGVIICGIFMIVPIVIQLFVPSIAAAYLLFITGLIMLLVAINNNKFGSNKKAKNLVVAIPCGVILATTVIAFTVRFIKIWNIQSDEKNYYSFVKQALLPFLKSSNFIGAPNKEIALIGSISENRDYMFTMLINKFGYITVVIFSIILIAMIYALIQIYKKQNSTFGKILTAGTATVFITCSISYILCNVGIVSFAWLPLPFVSGNVTTVLIMLAMGIMLSCFKYDSITTGNMQKNTEQTKFIKYNNGQLIISLK